MTQTTAAPSSQASLVELIDYLARFDGPPQEFLLHMLDGQCRIASAAGGAILRLTDDDTADVLALHPPLPANEPTPVWLAQSIDVAQKVCKQAVTLISPLRTPESLYEEAPGQYLIMLPLLGDAGVRGAEAFLINSSDIAAVNDVSERLELTVSLLSMYELRLTLQRSDADMRRLGQTIEIAAAVNEQARLTAAAMALCNEIAAHWKAERVSVGFLHHRCVKMQAMSHTEKFNRKMKLVQAIESAMEESVDQDLEVIYPASTQATFVCRAAGELASRYGPTTVCSMPLRRGGKTVGAVTIERAWDKPFELGELETLRLACDLVSPRLADLYAFDRWFGARLAADVREAVGKLIGPRHTWVKMLSVTMLVVTLFLIFARGEQRVVSSFAIEAVQQRVVPAPFDSYLATVHVQPGDTVQGGQTVLATLDTSVLLGRLAIAQAQLGEHRTKADLALRDGKTVQVQVANAEAARVEAEVKLLKEQINRAKLVSPIDGIVVVGDLDRQLGAPMQTGDVLFEIAPLDELRASLWVPEHRIVDIKVGQSGQLATVAHPGDYLPFVVEKINPIAQVIDNRNVFRVQVRLTDTRNWLRPGMEGVAKVDTGQASLAWIWSRDLINWLRMKWWW